MPRFAANLSMLFTEVPFLERLERAANAVRLFLVERARLHAVPHALVAEIGSEHSDVGRA